MYDHLAMVGIGLLSCLLALALPAEAAGAAGFVYLLVGVSKTVFGFLTGRAVRTTGVKTA